MGSLANQLLQDFLSEGSETVLALEDRLVNCSSLTGNSEELVTSTFRDFHTIKGGAGFLGLQDLVDLCHLAETLLDDLRRSHKPMTSAHIELLCETTQSLRDMFIELSAGRAPGKADERLVKKLKSNLEYEQSESGRSVLDERECSLQPKETSELTYERLLEMAADQLRANGVGPAAVPLPTMPRESAHDATMSSSTAIGEEKAAELEPFGKLGPISNESSNRQASLTSSVGPLGIRVDSTKLDDCVRLAGDLVLTRNRLSALNKEILRPELIEILQALERLSDGLHTSLLDLRMQPLDRVLVRCKFQVRSLAVKLGKKIEFFVSGNTLQADKAVLDSLAPILTHLIRNAVDHGIESPTERLQAGKPEAGRIEIKTSQAGDRMIVEVIDDGRGIDAELIKEAGVRSGFVSSEAAARMSDQDCYNLIFLSGFTTDKQVSDISGRGVGMDVVRQGIVELHGSVEVDSKISSGTIIRLILPVSLSKLSALVVQADPRHLVAVPIASVVEVYRPSEYSVQHIGKKEIILYRGELIPMYDLREHLAGIRTSSHEMATHGLILSAAGRTVAISMGEVLGREDLIVRPLSSVLGNTAGVSGSAMTPEGRIALILDVDELVRSLLLSTNG